MLQFVVSFVLVIILENGFDITFMRWDESVKKTGCGILLSSCPLGLLISCFDKDLIVESSLLTNDCTTTLLFEFEWIYVVKSSATLAMVDRMFIRVNSHIFWFDNEHLANFSLLL